jgi:hypothetical protein
VHDIDLIKLKTKEQNLTKPLRMKCHSPPAVRTPQFWILYRPMDYEGNARFAIKMISINFIKVILTLNFPKKG